MGLLDLLFPKKCVGCGKGGSYWCTECVSRAKPHFPQVCPVCERNSIDGKRHKYCPEPFAPDGLTAIWTYEGVPRKLIQKIKYKFVSDAAKDLVLPALKVLRETHVFENKNIVLVPIPLFWSRKNWRGFNQAEELGKMIALGMGWSVEKLLERKAKGRSQVGLNESQRKKNVEGLFFLAENYYLVPNDYCLVLFDDVWTTGSTMLEATKVLKRAGFKKVWCLTLAR